MNRNCCFCKDTIAKGDLAKCPKCKSHHCKKCFEFGGCCGGESRLLPAPTRNKTCLGLPTDSSRNQKGALVSRMHAILEQAKGLGKDEPRLDDPRAENVFLDAMSVVEQALKVVEYRTIYHDHDRARNDRLCRSTQILKAAVSRLCADCDAQSDASTNAAKRFTTVARVNGDAPNIDDLSVLVKEVFGADS